MDTKYMRVGSVLILALTAVFAVVSIAVGTFVFRMMKPGETQQTTKTITVTDIDQASREYCENPEKLDALVASATSQGRMELVTLAEKKKKEQICGTRATTKQTVAPTSTPQTDDTTESYNDYYYCSSDETDRCELCWIDDTNAHTCCYKTTEQVANGDDRCGPGDTKFLYDQRTQKF